MNEDKSARYNRLKRRVTFLSLAWGVLFLAALIATDLTMTLRRAAADIAGAAPLTMTAPITVVVYIVLLTVLNEVGSLPLAFYGGFVLERRYGLSTEPASSWAADQLKSLLLSLVLGCAAGAILYGFIARFPIWWWLPASLVFSALAVGLANLAPIVLLPLFYTLKPLGRDSLRLRLMGLAARAGTRVLDVYEWGLGAKTSKANAALTGIGRTRRILISDTMLAQYSDEEIEVVLAHELAHHVHGDIWKGLAFETGLIVAGFLSAALVLRRSAPGLGLDGVADPAGLPVLLLAAGAVSLVMMPAAYALSRAHERRADQFALTMTGNVPAFVSAMRRLGAQNLAEDNPSPLVQLLFHSHPPIRERIAAAQAFKA